MSDEPKPMLTPAERRAETDATWELWFRIAAGAVRIIAGFLGLVILGYQAFFEVQDRVILLVIAAGCLGPVVAASIAQIAASLPGGRGPRE
jgi:hypothetical protein